jgi:hypothetical protein
MKPMLHPVTASKEILISPKEILVKFLPSVPVCFLRIGFDLIQGSLRNVGLVNDTPANNNSFAGAHL